MLAPRPQAGQAPNPAAGLGGSGISFGIGLPESLMQPGKPRIHAEQRGSDLRFNLRSSAV
jgi:hypothetical protein